ncbi:MAG: CapA family protein [Spirochaetaceae bacterium]|nr:CapA family protein [Spirochaetaceae bacterium]
MDVPGTFFDLRRRVSGAGKGILIFTVVLFISCRGPDLLWVDYDTFPDPERSSLAGALAPGNPRFVLGADPEPGAIRLRYEFRLSTWEESEGEVLSASGVFYPLSRTVLVPRAEVWEGRTGISLEEARGSVVKGTANRILDPAAGVIPLRDLGPPYVALKVEGRDVSDPRYPLVLTGGLLFGYDRTVLHDRDRRRIEKNSAALSLLVKEAINPELEERPRLYRIAAGGDVMLARGVQELLFAEGPEAVLGGTAALVKQADLSLINLEGAVTDRGEPAEKTYVFRFNPRAAAALKDAGFDAALIANNHAFDFGLRGFFDTLDHLQKAGLAVLGAGLDRAAAAAPLVTGTPAFPVRVFGIASFGRERNGWDGLAFAADEKTPGLLHAERGGAAAIKGLLQNKASGTGPYAGVGLDIVFFHGGTEYTDYPDQATRNLYTELVAAGADLVIGTHPHVEQGFEWVLGKPVFWSLGDYVFNEMDDTPGGDKGLFIVLWFLISPRGEKTHLVYVDPYPVFMNRERTVISPVRQLDRFYRLTRALADPSMSRSGLSQTVHSDIVLDTEEKHE